MTVSDEDRVAAKVEEVDRLIADLQRRRKELLDATGAATAAPPPPRKAAVETKPPARTEEAPQLVTRTSAPPKKGALEKTLDSLPWKSFKKKEGEWAFLRDREGRLIDELQSDKDFVDRVRKEGNLVVGRYRYQVSEDKFLNRYFQP